jgi:hypothetical protein
MVCCSCTASCAPPSSVPASRRTTWHEALATQAREGTEAGVVLETVEKGYRLDGQVLRAAKVIVSA